MMNPRAEHEWKRKQMGEEPDLVIGSNDDHIERKAPRVSTNASATMTAAALHVDTPVVTESASAASVASIDHEESIINMGKVIQDIAPANNRNDEDTPSESRSKARGAPNLKTL
jgi:hypothetical protein